MFSECSSSVDVSLMCVLVGCDCATMTNIVRNARLLTRSAVARVLLVLAAIIIRVCALLAFTVLFNGNSRVTTCCWCYNCETATDVHRLTCMPSAPSPAHSVRTYVLQVAGPCGLRALAKLQITSLGPVPLTTFSALLQLFPKCLSN